MKKLLALLLLIALLLLPACSNSPEQAPKEDPVDKYFDLLLNGHWDSAREFWESQDENFEFAVQPRVAELKDAQQVAVIPWVILEDYVNYGNEKFAGKHKITVTVENKGDKDVASVTIRYIIYNERGYPVEMTNGNEHTFKNLEFVPGTKRMSLDEIQVSGQGKYVVAVVKEVGYYGGETWENPYYYWVTNSKPSDVLRELNMNYPQ